MNHKFLDLQSFGIAGSEPEKNNHMVSGKYPALPRKKSSERNDFGILIAECRALQWKQRGIKAF